LLSEIIDLTQIFSLPVRILYVSIRSPLSLLRRNEYRPNPSAFNLCSHGILLKQWTSFVVLLWIFPMHSIPFLADRTNGRAIATLLRLSSVCLSVTLCG